MQQFESLGATSKFFAGRGSNAASLGAGVPTAAKI